MKIFISFIALILLTEVGFAQPTRYERVIANRQTKFGSKQIVSEGPDAVFLDTIMVSPNSQRNIILDITATMGTTGSGDGQQMVLLTNLDGVTTLTDARRQRHPWHASGTLAKAHYLLTPIGNKVVITGYGVNGKVTWKISKK